MQVLCPHCQSTAELAESDGAEETCCPSCGARFRVSPGTTADHHPLKDQKLGKFELRKMLGQGAFGIVYLARDPELDRQVAVKTPRRGLLSGSEELDRFLREARAAAQLRHPSIVAVYEVGQAEGLPYLVCEFVEGMTLDDRLSAGKLRPREAAEMAAAIADALAYAHEHGVVHRDVKPSNVMLDEKNCPRVMDFGLARRDADEVTMTTEGQILGTPAYMSPEQARGDAHKVDGRSDVYSLGVVLYRMLTGEPPFRGTPRMLLHQVLNDEPRSPRRLNEHVPRDLETICLAAMAKEPAQRYHTAAALAADLRRFLAGEPISARPVGRAVKALRWVRRNPAPAGLLLACAVALLAIAGLSVGLAYNRQLADAHRKEEDERLRAEAALAKAETFLNLHRIDLAQRAWWENNPDRTRRLLAEIPEPHGWEWHYLDRLSHSERRVLTGHTNELFTVACSLDGRLIASGGYDQTVRLWDARSGKEVLTLGGFSQGIGGVAFSADGRYLACACGFPHQIGEVKVWKCEWPHGPDEPPVLSESLILRGLCGERSRVAFSPDGRHLAVAAGFLVGKDNGQVRVFEFPSGKPLRTLRTDQEALTDVAFSPDGQRLAACSYKMEFIGVGRDPAVVVVWEAGSGKELRRLPNPGGSLLGVAFSPDGRYLASAGADRMVKLWDAKTYAEVRSLRGHDSMIHGAAFRGDSKRLATASEDGTVKVWDIETGEGLLTFRGHVAGVYAVAYDRDGRHLVSGGQDRSLRVWDADVSQEARTVCEHAGGAAFIAFSPDGRWLASGGADRTVRLSDLRGGESASPLGKHAEGVTGVAFSKDGNWLASAAGDWQKLKQLGEIRVWDVRQGREKLRLAGHAGIAWGVAFSPDSAALASAGGELTSPGEVKLWEVPSGRPIRTLSHEKGFYRVTYSPDGRLLAGITNNDGVLVVWDAATGQERFRRPHESGRVWSVAFSPDSGRVAVGESDGTIRIRDAASGEVTATMRGHAGAAHGLAFSPDGRRLASGGDRTVRLWDLATSEEVLTLRGHASLLSMVAFSPDGHLLASSDEAGVVKVWDARPRDGR